MTFKPGDKITFFKRTHSKVRKVGEPGHREKMRECEGEFVAFDSAIVKVQTLVGPKNISVKVKDLKGE